MAKNPNRNYRNRNIYILSDSQAVIKYPGNQWITSKLVWDSISPSCNWPHITEFSCRCQGMRMLLLTKQQINWMIWDRNIRSEDLNQLAASQWEFPRKWLRVAQRETIGNIEIH
jgi:hypothetical protein